MVSGFQSSFKRLPLELSVEAGLPELARRMLDTLVVPSAESIHENLALIAQLEWPYAILWHLVLGVALVSLAYGWRPPARRAAFALTLPLVSVSGFAWIYGNVFNGLVFGAGTLALWAMAARLPQSPVRRAGQVTSTLGILLIGFGFVYPHFLEGVSLLVYAYAAPLGLVPCPTLSVVIGLTLLARGFGSHAWAMMLGMLGLFYGLFGAFELGVWMDLLLAAGALVLLTTTLVPSRLALPSGEHVLASR